MMNQKILHRSNSPGSKSLRSARRLSPVSSLFFVVFLCCIVTGGIVLFKGELQILRALERHTRTGDFLLEKTIEATFTVTTFHRHNLKEPRIDHDSSESLQLKGPDKLALDNINDKSSAKEIVDCTYKIKPEFLDENGFVRTWWHENLQTILLEMAWLNETTLYVLGYNPATILFNKKSNQTVLIRNGENTTDMGLERFETLDPLNDRILDFFEPRSSKCEPMRCTLIPTKTLQPGQAELHPFLCEVKEGSAPRTPPLTDVWQFSNRRADPREREGDLKTSIFVVVMSYNPHAHEMIDHAARIQVSHVYFGVCDSANSTLVQQYLHDLEDYVKVGYVSLMPLHTPCDFELGSKARGRTYKNDATCKGVLSQLALYNAKLYKDDFLYIGDLDEPLVPMTEDIRLPVVMQEILDSSPIEKENTCYISIMADQATRGDVYYNIGEKKITERFPNRCDCLPKDRSKGGTVQGSCGNLVYNKSILNVQITFFAAIHTHSACTAYNNKIFFDRPRDSPPARFWAPVDKLRVLHFSNMWSRRVSSKCNRQEASVVPNEFASKHFMSQAGYPGIVSAL
mmetsp:Transcript_108/g.366  ORF Transcript_108/g.366 Transcript_108/m.366 type:complete len:570 (-) Transcript_108:212-1921(-)